MSERGASLLACVAAPVASFAAFLLTLVLVLQFKYPNLERVGFADLHPVVPALAFCALLGGVAAFLFPAQWGRLAVLTSSAFWGFFFIAFVCLLFDGQVDWVPLGQAVLAVAVGAGGSFLGKSLSPRAGKRHLG